MEKEESAEERGVEKYDFQTPESYINSLESIDLLVLNEPHYIINVATEIAHNARARLDFLDQMNW